MTKYYRKEEIDSRGVWHPTHHYWEDSDYGAITLTEGRSRITQYNEETSQWEPLA